MPPCVPPLSMIKYLLLIAFFYLRFWSRTLGSAEESTCSQVTISTCFLPKKIVCLETFTAVLHPVSVCHLLHALDVFLTHFRTCASLVTTSKKQKHSNPYLKHLEPQLGKTGELLLHPSILCYLPAISHPKRSTVPLKHQTNKNKTSKLDLTLRFSSSILSQMNRCLLRSQHAQSQPQTGGVPHSVPMTKAISWNDPQLTTGPKLEQMSWELPLHALGGTTQCCVEAVDLWFHLGWAEPSHERHGTSHHYYMVSDNCVLTMIHHHH